MSHSKRSPWIFLFSIIALVSIGCGIQSLVPAIPTFPAIPPTPSTSDTSTGSSPMSGDWNAKTEFGRLAFTVNPNGANLTTAVVALANFTCGGTTMTTEVQTIGPFDLNEGQFSISVSLDPPHVLDVYLDGKYDAKTRTFSGTWEEDAYGDHCSGKWKSAAHK